MTQQLQAFFTAPEGVALYAVLIVGLADFVLGVLAALRDGTFRLDAVAAWLRKHLAGRIAPIGLLLLLGYFGAQAALSILAGAWAVAYTGETVASIRDSWGPGRGPQAIPED